MGISRFTGESAWPVESSKSRMRRAIRPGIRGARARNWSVSSTPVCCPVRPSSRSDAGPARTRELARRGYQVTAIDLVDLAVRRAKDKAQRAGVDIDFRVGDATRMDLGGPFDVVFDRGVYHGIRARNLSGFRKMLKRVTRPGSRWLTLAGN